MVLETLYPILNKYFLSPSGLTALSALIPLFIFYMIKKDPERELMPSFMFFQSDEKSESTSKALKLLSRNLLLLLHILLVLLFAISLAQPYLESGGQPEQSVLILDRSGSMEDFSEAKGFLINNIGETNSVIIVDDEARLVAEQVSENRAESIIRNTRHAHTETDIAEALNIARSLNGDLFISSDLDQTSDNKDIENILNRFKDAERNYKILDTERRNSHGIIDIEVNENNSVMTIRNFENDQRSLNYEFNNQSETVTIDSRSVEEVDLNSRPGKNTIKLQEDDFELDNNGYFYIPENQNIEIGFISGSENNYLKTVFELIDYTTFSHYEPPIEEDISADIIIVDSDEEILSQTVRNIEQKLQTGSDLIIFGQNGFSNLGFENLPVEDLGDNINQSVRLRTPLEVNLGRMEIRNVNVNSGEKWSVQSNSLVKSDYQNGDLILYNINDEEFRTDFLYPVFWKNVIDELSDNSDITDSNYKTGKQIRRENASSPNGRSFSGSFEIEHQGFYETNKGLLAANMLSEEESLRERISVENNINGRKTNNRLLQNYVLILIVILLLIELAYLYRIGDLR